jgi:hypothetical protein
MQPFNILKAYLQIKTSRALQGIKYFMATLQKAPFCKNRKEIFKIENFKIKYYSQQKISSKISPKVPTEQHATKRIMQKTINL